MVAELYPTDEYSGNIANWWVPSLACLGGLVHAAGFKTVETWKFVQTPKMLGHCRGYTRGVKGRAAQRSGLALISDRSQATAARRVSSRLEISTSGSTPLPSSRSPEGGR